MERWDTVSVIKDCIAQASIRKVPLEKQGKTIRIKFWRERLPPSFWCPFHPLLGAFILQGKLLDVRQNLESKLKEILKNFSEVGNKRCLSNNTEIMWKE